MPELRYERRANRYRDLSTGRFVSRTTVINVRDEMVAQLKLRLRDLAIDLNEQRIDLEQFQIRMTEEIKYSHIQAAALASGGVERLTQAHYEDVSQRLEDEFISFLLAYGVQISAGLISTAMLTHRTQMYARSLIRSFTSAEKITRIQDGANEARRFLDPAAQHCPDCPRYETNGWIPADQVIPVGEQCQCHGNCRCTVEYRFNPRAINLSDSLDRLLV